MPDPRLNNTAFRRHNMRRIVASSLGLFATLLATGVLYGQVATSRFAVPARTLSRAPGGAVQTSNLPRPPGMWIDTSPGLRRNFRGMTPTPELQALARTPNIFPMPSAANPTVIPQL